MSTYQYIHPNCRSIYGHRLITSFNSQKKDKLEIIKACFREQNDYKLLEITVENRKDLKSAIKNCMKRIVVFNTTAIYNK